jgi:putative ABC transport system permease protein
MWLLVGLAARNALRNVQRTMLTALTVVFGTALLTLALTWEHGVFGNITQLAAAGAGHVRLVDPDYAQREDLFPLYENVPDVEAAVKRVSAVDGVTSAYPRIVSGVTLSAGEEIGDVFGLAVGAPLDWYTEILDVDAHLVEGRMLENDDEIVLGSTLVKKTGVKLGEELLVLGLTQDGAMSPVKGKVVGIVHASNALIDQQVYLTFPKVQYMTDMDGAATEILVYGEDYWDAADLRDAVKAGGAGGALQVEAWSDREPWSGILATFTVIQTILSGIIVFITALGVWNTMMMSVLERTGEIGVMRAMGLGRMGAVSLFVMEALAIAAIGGLVGVALGAIPAYALEVYGVDLGERIVQNAGDVPFSARMHGDLSWGVAVDAFLLGLLMAVVGSGPPALRAASIQPVAAMRSRR